MLGIKKYSVVSGGRMRSTLFHLFLVLLICASSGVGQHRSAEDELRAAMAERLKASIEGDTERSQAP
jgi:hypothetical protein